MQSWEQESNSRMALAEGFLLSQQLDHHQREQIQEKVLANIPKPQMDQVDISRRIPQDRKRGPGLSAGKPTGVRGVSWRRKEILDLLALWGEKKVQDALRSSHRNIETFEAIAKGMAMRGHNRSAVECRTKAKALRLEYKRVVCHNARSDSGHATCPFFEELHNILRGDASVKPKRVARSLTCHQHEPAMSFPDPAPEECGEELFTHDLPVIKVEDIYCSSPGPSGTEMEIPLESQPHIAPADDDFDDDDDGTRTEEATRAEDVSGPRDEEGHGGTQVTPPRDAGQALPQGTHLAELSPATQLAMMRTKKRRGVDRVTERMMEQCSREHQEAMAFQRQVHQESMSFQRKVLRAMHEFREADAEEARLDRELMSAALERNFQVLEASMMGLERLGRALLQQEHRPLTPPRPSTCDTQVVPPESADTPAATPPPATQPLGSQRPVRPVSSARHKIL